MDGPGGGGAGGGGDLFTFHNLQKYLHSAPAVASQC